MADVDTGDILRIGAVWTVQDAWEVANVWHARVTAGGGLSFADAADDIAEYMEDLYQEIRLRLTDEMDTLNLTLQNLTQDTTYGAFSWATPLVGGSASEMTAPGVCLLAWARTYKPRVQIRKYFGVFTEEYITDGAWVATVRSDCNDAMALHTAAYAGTNGLTVLGVAYNRTLATYTDPTSLASTAEPAYQRRRKRGRGS